MAEWICEHGCTRECGCYPAGHYEGGEIDADFCHLCARELYKGDCVNMKCPPKKKKITKQAVSDLVWGWHEKEHLWNRQSAAVVIDELWEFLNERRN